LTSRLPRVLVVSPTMAHELMPENAADDCPNDRPGDIGPVASLFNDLLALDAVSGAGTIGGKWTTELF